ncbi:MAG TPA: carbamoyltransferase C-terminal domain-containing protein [Lacipirellulaceae bacterium]|nr:carbamoyltransferase C-terminal domain-containing protein [Lacipirellulaceae bacterium]
MNILGINAFHGDASAALVIDGRLVAAVEEERFNRIKHWAGFPAASIRYVLEEGGVTARELDHVAVSFDPKANLGRKALFTLVNRPSLRSVIDRLRRQGKSLSLRQQLADACAVPSADVRAEFHNVEHHDAHLACGFLLSPFESASILSIDGMGDFVSTVTARGQGQQINKIDEVFYPHSLGFLYNALTIYLGFPNYGDEYKVMGLAPYGKPEYIEEFRRMIFPKGRTFELNLDYFTHPQNGISMSWEAGSPKVEPFHSKLLEDRLGPPRRPNEELTPKHENIAASLQRVTEEIIFHLLNRLHEAAPNECVVLVGGCAMNSVANGKVTRETPFRQVYVPVGAADNGTALGAAFYVWHQLLGKPRTFQLEHAFWGSGVHEAECRAAASQVGLEARAMDESALVDHVVNAICDGKVVGWFQERMEFGARALGSRSLLADPRRADMRELINLKIKFREKFRPFAPSVLEEHVGEYFAVNEPSPFMERVLPIRPEKQAEIPAVTHVDGSGRLQTVSRRTSPLYWSLIERFRQRTGVPMLLNTSLNENEPIVRTPQEAVSCFQRTAMDMLVLGNFVIERNGQ